MKADFTRSDGGFATEPTPEIGLPGALGVLAEKHSSSEKSSDIDGFSIEFMNIFGFC